jgi:cytosine/adenosine deaminase-related metal-dependent hydrolase
MLRDEKIAGVAFKQYIDGLGMKSVNIKEQTPHNTGEELRLSVAPHAPYSSSRQLIKKIFKLNNCLGRKTSIHWQESKDDTLFCRSHTGIMDKLLRNIWPDIREKYKNIMDEKEFVKRYFNENTIIVHAVESNPEIFSEQFNHGVNVVLCPRSNNFISGKYPKVDELYSMGVQFALGTDSLASVADLDIRKEATCIREITKYIQPEFLLKSLTLYGARTLGIDNRFGTLEPGRSAKINHLSFKGDHKEDRIERFLVDNLEQLPIKIIEC